MQKIKKFVPFGKIYSIEKLLEKTDGIAIIIEKLKCAKRKNVYVAHESCHIDGFKEYLMGALKNYEMANKKTLYTMAIKERAIKYVIEQFSYSFVISENEIYRINYMR